MNSMTMKGFVVSCVLWLAACGPPETQPTTTKDMPQDLPADMPIDQRDTTPDEGTNIDETLDLPIDADMAGLYGAGTPCNQDVQCAGGKCLRGEPWQDGYCTEAYCTLSDVCDEPQTACVTHPNMNFSFCPKICLEDTDCRQGYSCQGHQRRRICLPESWAPPGESDGSPCEEDSDCTNGTCLKQWFGGYCTRACETVDDCAADGERVTCASQGDNPKRCLRQCQYGNDCRFGYTCLPVKTNVAACIPDNEVLSILDTEKLPFTFTCQSNADGTIPYTISPNTIGYTLVAFSSGGRRAKIEKLTLPDRRVINPLQRHPERARVRSLHGWFHTLAVPWLSSHHGDVMAGEHIAHLDGRGLCLALFEKTKQDRRIDINLHFAKFDQLNATTAKTDPKMMAVISRVRLILSRNNLALGEVRYSDLPEDVAEQASNITNSAQLNKLGKHTTYPEGGLDGALSIDVYMVESLFYGVLGRSLGIPGLPGVHGTQEIGVVVALGDLNASAALYATTIAHEIGHYMGLRHTTEQDDRTTDAFDDTPHCVGTIASSPWYCPDAGNLMFPTAIDVTTNTLSAGQIQRVALSPWSK